MQELTPQELAEDIRRSGVQAGDTCMVHGSLKGIGALPGGPPDLVRALQQALTPEGLLVMPAFSYDAGPAHEFNAETSPARTGLLAETFRGMPDVVRSLHPTHSVCAWGKQAHALCAGHETAQPFGPDSPLHRLMDGGGKVMLLGVGYTTLSMIHVCECLLKLPYLHIPTHPSRRAEIPLHLSGGEILAVTIGDFPGCSAAFGTVEHHLRKKAAVRDGRIGAKFTQLFLARDLYTVVRAMLQNDPFALLCTNPACACCPLRRRALSSHASGEGEATSHGPPSA